jgi:ABC-type transport system involved in multi-copper enzyme maturation permease subunit
MRFEALRSMTFWRVMVWFSLTFFPVILLSVAISRLPGRVEENVPPGDLAFGVASLIFILLPQVVTVLSLLLWATPVVHSELEGQTWVYAVVRPGGRRSVLLGKYVVAVLWTISATCVAATCLVPAIYRMTGEYTMRIWAVTCMLNVLAALTYGAAFVLIGTLIQRRAMVAGFLFALIVEALLSLVPAIISQFTVSFRLRSLLIQYLDITLTETESIKTFFNLEHPPIVHLLGLLAYVGITLGIALWRVQSSQFSWQSEL